MALLALQYGWQPLLTKSCIGPDVKKSSVVVVQEVSKFCIAFIMLYSEGGKKAWDKAINEANAGKPWTVQSSIEIAGIPSLLYAVQNWLLFYAAANMDPLAFNLVNQTKLIWTAFFVYMIMGKKQSPLQILAICIMMFVAVLISTGGSAPKGNSDEADQSYEREFFHGILPNLGAALISGVAAALSQRATQGVGRSGYLFTMELCVIQSMSFIPGLLYFDGAFFGGWDLYTPLPIVNNALGGIFTGQVVKFAGGVRKGFAVIAALIITALLQRAIYGTPLTLQLYIALPCVILANVMYARNPYVAPTKVP